MAQNIAHHHFLLLLFGTFHHLPGLLHRQGNGLFHKNVQTCIEALESERHMGIGIGAHGQGIGLGRLQGVVQIIELGDPPQLESQLVTPFGTPGNQPGKLETVRLLVGAGMGRSHVPATDDDNLHRIMHGIGRSYLFPPFDFRLRVAAPGLCGINTIGVVLRHTEITFIGARFKIPRAREAISIPWAKPGQRSNGPPTHGGSFGEHQ